MIKNKRVLLIAWLIIILLFLIVLVIPTPSNCQHYYSCSEYPKVTITLLQTGKTAKVSPGDSRIVEFDGIVYAEFPPYYNNPAATINVSLAAEDTWGSCKLVPNYIIFHESGEQQFNVTVTAPPNLRWTDWGTFTVTGSWIMDPGGFYGIARPLGGVHGRIYIAEYYNFSLSSPKSTIKTKPGEGAHFELQIENEGNSLSTFTIEVYNDEAINKRCHTIVLTQSRVEVLPNDTKTIGIDVNVGDRIKSLGKQEILVKVVSDKGINEGVEPQVITYELDVPHEYLPYTNEFSYFILVIVIVILFTISSLWQWRARKKEKKRKNK